MLEMFRLLLDSLPLVALHAAARKVLIYANDNNTKRSGTVIQRTKTGVNRIALAAAAESIGIESLSSGDEQPISCPSVDSLKHSHLSHIMGQKPDTSQSTTGFKRSGNSQIDSGNDPYSPF